MRSYYSNFAIWRCDAEHCSDSGGGECVLYFVTKDTSCLPLASDYADEKYDVYCFHTVKLVTTVEEPSSFQIPDDSSDGQLHQGQLYGVCPLWLATSVFVGLYGVPLATVEEFCSVLCILIDGEGNTFPLLAPIVKNGDLSRIGLRDYGVVQNGWIKRRRAA